MRSVQVLKRMGLLKLWKDILEPSATQIGIKVQACGVCHSDSFTKEGLFPGRVIDIISDKIGSSSMTFFPC